MRKRGKGEVKFQWGVVVVLVVVAVVRGVQRHAMTF